MVRVMVRGRGRGRGPPLHREHLEDGVDLEQVLLVRGQRLEELLDLALHLVRVRVRVRVRVG